MGILNILLTLAHHWENNLQINISNQYSVAMYDSMDMQQL